MIQKGFSELRARLTGAAKPEAEDSAQHVRLPAYLPQMTTGTDGIEALRKVLGTDGPEPLEQAIGRVRQVPTEFGAEGDEAWPEEDTASAAQIDAPVDTTGDTPADTSVAAEARALARSPAPKSKSGEALARAAKSAEVLARAAEDTASMTKASTLPEVTPAAPTARKAGLRSLLSGMRMGGGATADKPEFTPKQEKRIAADPFVKRLGRLT